METTMNLTMNVAGTVDVNKEEVALHADNDRQFLDFEISKVQTLTLEQLSRTEKENDYNGNPLMGIYHF